VVREMTDEQGKTQLMVLAVEPLLVPTLERSLQGKVEEETVRVGLDPHDAHYLTLGGTGLILQEEIMLE
jgi:hypothetical protein